MRFEGVYVAAITPFDGENKLCLKSLEKHLLDLADRGVHGFVTAATTGESPSLEASERKAVFELTKEIGRKRNLKIVAGCGSNNTARALESLHLAEELGYDAALVVTPYYNKPTAEGLLAHYTFLADNSQVPILLYNVPGRTAVNLTTETVVRLLEHPRIVGLKEASGQYGQWLQLAHSVDWSDRSLMAGDDDAFAPLLAFGGSGIVSASANVYPEGFVQIYEAARAQRWEECFRLQTKLLPLVRAMFAETSPAPIKYALEKLGRVSSSLRLPLVPVGANTRALIDEVLRGLEIGVGAR